MNGSDLAGSEKRATSTATEWISVRETRTKQAIQDGDLDSLKRISALPGGFGGEHMRKKAWSALLRTHRLIDEPALVSEQEDEDVEAVETDIKPSLSKPDDEVIASSSIAGFSQAKPHPNERQVKLDTDRSFVTYPRGIPRQSKLELQADLNDLIVGVLRKYPVLSYFQGYHDILSVLYLTFIPPRPRPQRSRSSSRTRTRTTKSGQRTPEALSVSTPDNKAVSEASDTQLEEKATSCPELANNELAADAPDTEKLLDSDKPPGETERKLDGEGPPPPYSEAERDNEDWRELRRCAEMISLNRVRDAMGSGMEGMMGLLRILKRISRAADPELSHFSAQISPVPTLPFFALSWVLTLFSHDCDSLQPVQRMFDFLLARNPIYAVYLAAGILISKKPQMLQFAKDLGEEYQDDPTLLHPLFVRLPPLYADTPSEPEPPATPVPSRLRDFEDDTPNPYKPIKLSELFLLTDTLMDQYPWDGDVIRGQEVLGEGSAVSSYPLESAEGWTPAKALEMVDVEVVKPGAGSAMDEDEEEEATVLPDVSTPSYLSRKRTSVRLPRNKLSTVLAVGVVVLGVGIAVYGVRAGGNQASWGRWWGYVIRGWVGKEGRKLSWRLAELAAYGRRAVENIL